MPGPRRITRHASQRPAARHNVPPRVTTSRHVSQIPWFAPVEADPYVKHVQPWEEGGGAFLFFFRAALCWIGTFTYSPRMARDRTGE